MTPDKPGPGYEVDWSHPLAQGLVGCVLPNDGVGRALFDAVSGRRLAGASGAPVWEPGHTGVRLRNGGSLTLPVFDVPELGESVAITVVGVLPLGFEHWARWASIGESPTARVLDILNNDGAPCPRVYVEAKDQAGSQTTVQVAVEVGAPLRATACLDAQRRPLLYINGRLVGQGSSLTGTPNRVVRYAPCGILEGAAGSFAWEACYAHGRALSAAEVAWLHAEPYAFLKAAPAKRGARFIAGGA